LSDNDLKEIADMKAKGKSVAAIAADLEVSRPLIYRALRSVAPE
jgi:DNA-binding phage protein